MTAKTSVTPAQTLWRPSRGDVSECVYNKKFRAKRLFRRQMVTQGLA